MQAESHARIDNGLALQGSAEIVKRNHDVGEDIPVAFHFWVVPVCFCRMGVFVKPPTLLPFSKCNS